MLAWGLLFPLDLRAQARERHIVFKPQGKLRIRHDLIQLNRV